MEKQKLNISFEDILSQVDFVKIQAEEKEKDFRFKMALSIVIFLFVFLLLPICFFMDYHYTDPMAFLTPMEQMVVDSYHNRINR